MCHGSILSKSIYLQNFLGAHMPSGNNFSLESYCFMNHLQITTVLNMYPTWVKTIFISFHMFSNTLAINSIYILVSSIQTKAY